jgi:hypothetical protein
MRRRNKKMLRSEVRFRRVLDLHIKPRVDNRDVMTAKPAANPSMYPT